MQKSGRSLSQNETDNMKSHVSPHFVCSGRSQNRNAASACGPGVGSPF